MPKFKFKAKDLNGKVIRGLFFAKDEEDLREIVDNLDYFLISSRKIAESSQIFTFLEKIKVEDISLFCRQLAIMVSSGLELKTAIDVLKNGTKNPKLKEILEVAHHDLLQGKSLSSSFAKYPKTFPLFFRNMIRIGEISGKFPLVLNKLADYYDKDNKIKRKAKSALAYPIMLVCMAIVVLIIMAVFVMPTFKDVFDDMGAELPQITIMVIGFTDFIRNNILLLLLGFIGFIALWLFLKRFPSVRLYIDKLKLKVPIVKDVNIALITSRFTSGFQTLLSSSIPIVEAIETMSHLLGNMYVEEQMKVCASEIKRGESIAKSLETIGIFPSMLCEMIRVGEETGRIEEVLTHVTEYFENEVDQAFKKMTGAIEPIMILIIGGIVVVCLLAVFLPMLEITSAIDSIET